MSAVQSHIQTGPPNPQFPFPVADNHSSHPLRPLDVPRAMNNPHISPQLPPQQQPMLNLYGGPQQQQHSPQANPQFQPQIPPQQQQQPPAAHPALTMMPPGTGLVANTSGQPSHPHQAQLQHAQHQQRAMMQQRAMGNPQMPTVPGPFAPGVPPQMRRISAQPPPHPQAAPQMAAMAAMQPPQQPQNPAHLMGMPQGITNQLRQGSLNARLLASQAQSQAIPPEVAMAMSRHQQQQQLQQQQQQQAMVNGLAQPQLVRAAPPGQLPLGSQHPMPQLSQQQPPPQQHRTPFQQHGPLPPHQSHASSPARPSSHHSQTGTPTGGLGTGTAAQRPAQTSPEQMFMNTQQPPQQPQQSQQRSPIFPTAGPQQQQPRQPVPPFPFLPTDSTEVSSNRAQPFHITPAQQLQQLQQGQEPFSQVMLPHAQQRPAPSRAEPGPSRSPRPPSRHPPQNPPTARPPPPVVPHMQPGLSAASPHHRRGTSAGAPLAPPEVPSLVPVPPQMVRPPHLQNPQAVLGYGQGIIRLLSFSAAMTNEKLDRLNFDHWAKIVSEFFAPQALWKLTLWKDNERREAKPFEIGPDTIAMLLLVSCQSGVRSMSLVLDGARERMVMPGTATVECPEAQWVWRFYDGHTIVLRGNFACQVSAFHNRTATADQPAYTLKFESMSFDSNVHDRLLSIDAIRGTRTLENVQKTPATTTQGSPDTTSSAGASGKMEEAVERPTEPDPRVVIDHATLPQEPINAFGIPQASMRCLELAESVGQMLDLIVFGSTHGLGPQDALGQIGGMIKQQMGIDSGSASSIAPTMPPGENKQTLSLLGTAGAERQPHPMQPPPQQQQQPLPQPPPQPQQQLQQQPLPTQQPPPQPVPPPAPQQQQQQQPQAGPSQPPTPSSKGPPTVGVSAPAGPGTLKRKAQAPPEPAEPPSKRVTRRKSKTGSAG